MSRLPPRAAAKLITPDMSFRAKRGISTPGPETPRFSRGDIPGFLFSIRNIKTANLILFALAALLLAACSLAGDVTPPPGFEDTSSLPVAGPLPTTDSSPVIPPDSGLGYPATTPSAVEGAALYAANCTRCHGLTGGGDGELVSQIEFPVPAFNTPDLARTTSPARWFSIITDGNLERVMPPWSDSLTEAQRWSLVAYLYSLSAEPNIESGKVVYEANCANCHGAGGQGDGPDAQGALTSFGDQAFMAAKSNDDFFDAVTDGINGEHKFAEALGEDERRAAVDYVRAFSYDSTGLAAAPGDAASGTVSGTITNGTPDSSVPGDQPVVLHLFDNFQETGTITTTVTSGGAFEFADIELVPDRAMIVSARYGEVLYTSDVVLVVAGQTEYQLPIQIFEATTDSNVIVVERMHVILDFQAGEAQIGELFIIGNTSDKTFVSASPDGPTFSAALPAGFTNLSFQDDIIGGRYQQTTEGFADTLPIRPGAGAQQILLSFNLPYADALDFAQKLSYSTTAVSVLLPDTGVTLSGDGLLDDGVRDVQGANYRTFSASDLSAGGDLIFSLKGKPALAVDAASGSSAAATPSFDLRTALIGGLSLALVVAVIAYWWIQRGSGSQSGSARSVQPRLSLLKAAPTQTYEELIDELAELDEGFEAGEFSEAEYHAERDKLKAELKRLMEKERSA